MSIDQPDACGLVEIALKTFREVVLSAASAEQRFPALMIANALSIAERELKGAADPAAALRRLLGEEGDADTLLRRLCEAIAEGRFDGRTDLRPVLWEITRARLAVSNPKYLQN
ncbi:DUF6285 domain-containing protein [Azospirillum canadense]|uniref:DUF6285 domain-containing protein n=1 Tax=Azospirillum canadense TaxID=403962 RepID=UPI0022278364|nr:DUF6285 domain-containing protein [Azospirillum canadense]MCW2240468.1 hypothetical protein [Azospirillum canadense]